MLVIDRVRVQKVAVVLRKVASNTVFDDFTNPTYYPPKGSRPEDIALYFLVMVAMDHRLSRPGRPYEGLVDGRFLRGADALYALGARMFRENPGFFEPRNLAKISEEEVLKWLTTDDGRGKPPDPKLRAKLLRDLGRKLLELYRGSAYQLIEASQGRLRGHPEAEPGFLDLLRTFLAYNDPVEKKSHLLAKFLERRGVLKVVDARHKHVPIDNHVTRLALRLGIVAPDGRAIDLFKPGAPEVDDETDVYIRMVVRRAWDLVAKLAGLDPYKLDDILWGGARKCCRPDTRVCVDGCSEECVKLGFCREGRCVFEEVCPFARRNLVEHTFYNTWWY